MAKGYLNGGAIMADTQKEYLVGTVRPTNRPEAGQELDLYTLIPAKVKFVSLTMNFTRGTEEEFKIGRAHV